MMVGSVNRTFSAAKKTLYNITHYQQCLPYDQWPSSSWEQCKSLGISLEGLAFIHIAGTKGKGSTCAFIEKLLRDQGLSTSLFTSPHLVSPCERIRINGEPISEDEFTATFWECHDILAAKNNGKIPHYFRMIFFMFLKISRQRNIDVAIVEVGIGGRYDSTNFIMPQVCGITTVDLDHQNLLGNNLQAIAWHKSGIMKQGVPVISQRYQPEEVCSIFVTNAQKMKSKLYFALPLEAYEDNHTLQIHGSHQRDNAALAIAIVQIFLQKRAMGKSWYPAEVLKPFSLPQLMRISLETTWNAGRSHIIPWRISEELSITCYLDGAHNSSTVASCIHWFADNLFHGPQPLNVREVLCVLLFTVTNLKDPFPIFQAITTTKPGGGQLFDEVIFSTSNKRDTPLSEVQEQELDAMRTSWQTLYTQPRPHVVASVPKALSELEILAYSNPFKRVHVLVCGSFYLVGSTMVLLQARGVDLKVYSVSHVA